MTILPRSFLNQRTTLSWAAKALSAGSAIRSEMGNFAPSLPPVVSQRTYSWVRWNACRAIHHSSAFALPNMSELMRPSGHTRWEGGSPVLTGTLVRSMPFVLESVEATPAPMPTESKLSVSVPAWAQDEIIQCAVSVVSGSPRVSGGNTTGPNRWIRTDFALPPPTSPPDTPCPTLSIFPSSFVSAWEDCTHAAGMHTPSTDAP